MTSKTIPHWRLLGTTVLAGALSLSATAAEFTQERLENAVNTPENWLLPFQNYGGWRYTSLDQINRDNVADLKVAFTLPIGTAMAGANRVEFEQHAIVDNGIMWIDDGWGAIYKVDLTAGDRAQVIWKADGAVSKDEGNRTRGIAAFGDAIYHNLIDGRVIAVSADTGEFLWDVQVARMQRPDTTINIEKETFTASPLPVDGKILVGQSGGDNLTRGWLAALDADTGDEMWRTYMVPAPGEPGHETWKDDHEVWKIGGAGLWTTGTYDPEQRLTFWGTGNAQPMFDVEYRPGDNLYAAAVVAMNVDDGGIAWYFQYVPNEGWDYDENGVHQIYDIEVNGTTERVLGHFARNGYHYRLNARTGQFVDGTPYVNEVNWTAGLDPKTGKPVEYDPTLDVQQYIPATRTLRGDPHETICPTWLGGTRWQPPAYNPDKQISYTAAIDGCYSQSTIEVLPAEGGGGMMDANGPGGVRGRNGDVKYYGLGGDATAEPEGIVVAMDVLTNQVKARYSRAFNNQSGVLATGGGLVWSASLDGYLYALDDETLELKYQFNTGMQIKAPPFAFAVNGKQYIAIAAGGQSLHPQIHPSLANMPMGAMVYFFAL